MCCPGFPSPPEGLPTVPQDPADREVDALEARIRELGDKSTNLLLFLSFAIVGAASVKYDQLPADPGLVRSAMRWWMLAVFPVLLGVLPVKELRAGHRRWYGIAVFLKILVLWVAVALSFVGAIQFLRAIS
jgi:hypothetical protein